MLNMKNIVIEPRVVDPALTFYGRIAELDLDIYTYDEWFLNDEGEDEAMIPDGTVLMGHSDGEGQIEYGAVTQMEDKKVPDLRRAPCSEAVRRREKRGQNASPDFQTASASVRCGVLGGYLCKQILMKGVSIDGIQNKS